MISVAGSVSSPASDRILGMQRHSLADQRNSPGFYRSDRGDISDRVDSPYDRDSTC